jgi:uncharacterized protein (DUF1800 family)
MPSGDDPSMSYAFPGADAEWQSTEIVWPFLPTIRTGDASKTAMKQLMVVPIAVLATLVHAGTLPTDRTIVHVLNRIAFGPRAADVEKVRAMGLDRYIDSQLHPERLADPAIETRLTALTALDMSSREIADTFVVPRPEARRARASALNDTTAPPMRTAPRVSANRLLMELTEQKLQRAIYSERQLQEVLTDFWFNHFNVDARKGPVRFMLTEYERDVIRPRVLGTFRELLGAVAKSPAMLFYLDNWMSAAETAGTRRPQNRRGLNENYARELMELHTLGADAGYTQRDVAEVARAFTGWTIDGPRRGGGFTFQPNLHDTGEKMVLGHRLPAGGGLGDGEEVLDILADHPRTARFIATRLARRFVSDEPPASLVERAAARFRDTRGDLREVMRAILTSPEFLSPDSYHAKVKTPLEYVVSALRAAGADVQDVQPLVRALQQLGMPLYQCQPPTGYQDSADAWVNAGALVNRLNFAVAIAGNQFRGISSSSLESIDALLEHALSESTLATIASATTVQQRAALMLGSPEFQRR